MALRRASWRTVAAIAAAVFAATPAVADNLGGPAMRAMTPAETGAHAIWMLRSGLNVAALQCQFSPYLATVRNYNDLLKQHDAEFASAFQSLERHFRRHDGAGGKRSFDSFTTRVYNSFSALDAQIAYCNAAGDVGREALAIKRGAIGAFAPDAVRRLRNALNGPTVDPYRQLQLAYVRVPRIPDPCLDRRGRPVRNCKL